VRAQSRGSGRDGVHKLQDGVHRFVTGPSGTGSARAPFRNRLTTFYVPGTGVTAGLQEPCLQDLTCILS
jgi:hypothetical protein